MEKDPVTVKCLSQEINADLYKANLNLDWTVTHELLDHCLIILFSESQCLKSDFLISHAMTCYHHLAKEFNILVV